MKSEPSSKHAIGRVGWSQIQKEKAMNDGNSTRRLRSPEYYDEQQQRHYIIIDGRRHYRRSENSRSVSFPTPAPETESIPSAPRVVDSTRKSHHPLLWLGLGMVAIVVLIILYNMISSLIITQYNNTVYGTPRVSRFLASVGHNDSARPSLFICVNDNKTISVIEYPGGDYTHAKVYSGGTLTGGGQDSDVCQLRFVDMSGNGKPDMYIDIAGATIIYRNDGREFTNK